MDIQAEINLLSADLARLQSPGLVSFFRRLLDDWKNGSMKDDPEAMLMVRRALESEEAIRQGEVCTLDEMDAYLDQELED